MPSPHDAQLHRGKACTSCRRRKMKCDGGRPFCGQCVKGQRTDDCEYTDNQGRTRTQVLEENVALLQARIQELENPNIAARRVYLRDPYESFRQSERRAQILAGQGNEQMSNIADVERMDTDKVTDNLSEALIENFVAHAGTFGFALDINRFLKNVRLPLQHPDRPHACLLFAIYLHGARLSNEANIQRMEETFLEQALLYLQDAIRDTTPDPVAISTHRRLDAIQTEILIAMHFFALGYVVEGRHHCAAANTLSVSCGLHSIPKFKATSGSRSQEKTRRATRLGLGLTLRGPREDSSATNLEPPKDADEYAERVNLFWTVFACDRVWGSATGSPNLLVDSSTSGCRIDTAFPNSEREGQVHGDRSVQRFLAGEAGSLPAENENVIGLRARAAALFERANSLSTQWHEESSPTKRGRLREDARAIARVVTSLARCLPPVDKLVLPSKTTQSSQNTEDSHTMMYLTTHALAHSAMFALHGLGASLGETTAINASLTHATEVVKIIEKCCHTEMQHSTVCPILAMLGESAANVFLGEEERLTRSLPPSNDMSSLPQALQSRIGALRSNIQRIIDAFRLVDSWNSPIFGKSVRSILDRKTAKLTSPAPNESMQEKKRKRSNNV